MDNVVTLHNYTSLDIPVERVLSKALESADSFERVLIIAVPKKEGEPHYHASSTGNKALHLWDIEHFKTRLLHEY